MADNLTAMLERSVLQYGSRPALWNPNTAGGYDLWTYDEMWNAIRRVAGQLLACGIEPGQSVGLLAENRAWWPVADFAIMSVGACTVPMYPASSPHHIEYIIAHSEMKGIFVQSSQLVKLLQISPDAIPNLAFVIVLDPDDGFAPLLHDAEKRWSVFNMAAWLAKPDEVHPAEWAARRRAVSQDSLATIVYTSGTTGVPKGVMLTHGNLLANIEGIRALVPLFPTDRSLSYLPLSHIFERTAGQFSLLDAGASIAYARSFRDIAEDFKRMPPVVMTTVPRLLEKIHEEIVERVGKASRWTRWLFDHAVASGAQARVDGVTVPAWKLAVYDRLVFERIRAVTGGQIRMMVVGGAPMPAYVGRFFTAVGLTVIEGYGMTETSPVVSVNDPESPRLGTAGRVLQNVEVRIADDGEILVRGPSVTKGYFKDPDSTEQAFTADGWLRTGDIGSIEEGQYLRVTDRKKHLIVLSTGKKVTPAPVEAAILKNRFVHQVMLIGQGRKYVSALVVPNEALVREWLAAQGRADTPRDRWGEDTGLLAFMQTQIDEATAEFSAFERPKRIILAKEPFSLENGLMTATLKVRVAAVLAAYAAEIDALYAAYPAPVSPADQT